MGDPCFIESIPGIALCNINKTDANGVSNLGDNSSEADGSVDLALTQDLPIVDDAGLGINIDNSNGQDIELALTISKNDLRNKLVLLNTLEDIDIVYVPLNSTVTIPDDTKAIIYETVSSISDDYKVINLYLPNAISWLPRGTYTVTTYKRIEKSIGEKIFTNWTPLTRQTLTIKTDAIQGSNLNNKYLRTAFNRGVLGGFHGVNKKLKKDAPIVVGAGTVTMADFIRYMKLLANTNSTLQEQIDTNKANIESNTDNINANKTNITNNTEAIEALETTTTNITSKISTINKSISDLDAEIEEVATDIKNIEVVTNVAVDPATKVEASEANTTVTLKLKTGSDTVSENLFVEPNSVTYFTLLIYAVQESNMHSIEVSFMVRADGTGNIISKSTADITELNSVGNLLIGAVDVKYVAGDNYFQVDVTPLIAGTQFWTSLKKQELNLN